jgi:hypothetical protein
MSISVVIVPISDLPKILQNILKDNLNFSEKYLTGLIIKFQNEHLRNLHDDLWVLIEYPYIDKVYRDSFYNYFSSKLGKYERDSIRLSFFSKKIEYNFFRNEENSSYIQENYLGFIVIRPTLPSIIGRSILSPRAFKNHNFYTCCVKVPVTVNAVKLYIEGFPHSSQDTETITCAETTIWSIMEYFGNRYSDYQPVLPSKITKTLNEFSFERQIPSKGLNIQQISFALKEFGFGTRIYSRDEYVDEFEVLLSTYIESGIPIVIALQNVKTRIGHALLSIGHSLISDALIDNLQPQRFKNNVQIYESNKIEKEFIFIDDNHPPYRSAFLSSPASNYTDPMWKGCEITHFIVPLYSKVYLEAFEARKFVFSFLTRGFSPIKPDSEILLRFFLTSSRSFKDKIALNKTVQDDFKELVLGMPMPKFIWIAELSNKALFKQNKANGIIILDATEANNRFIRPLILGAYDDHFLYFDKKTEEFAKITLPLVAFSIYENNLKKF